MSEIPEVTHLSEGDVHVTDARIVVGPTTFVFENVTSVRAIELPRPTGPGSTILWATLVACGVVGILAIGNYWWWAAIPVVLAIGLFLGGH